MTCGATGICMLIIESRAYVFHIGDCKGFLFRNEVLYKLNLDHVPVFYLLFRVVETKGIEFKMQEDLFNMID
jgi:serine/threonine protein phosphatase PrpC